MSYCRRSSHRNGWRNARSAGASPAPIYQSKVLGELPDISDDTLILPKWIEAAQKPTRRPIVAADIARFGEDETVIMRREGGWIRVYRAHHIKPTR
jgi:hypothetical protein